MSGIRIAATVVYSIVCLVLVFLVFKGKGQGADLSGGDYRQKQRHIFHDPW